MATDNGSSGRLNRRTFIKGVGAAGTIGLAGCSGDGGDGGSDDGGSTDGDNGLPVLAYSSIDGSVGGDRFQRWFKSETMREEVCPHIGTDYEVEFVPSGSGSTGVANAMAAGEAMTGQLAYSSRATAQYEEFIPSGYSIIAPLKIITEGWGIHDNYAVLSDSDIETISDLEGKDIAVNSFGSAVDITARLSLRQEELDPESDVNMREIGFGAMMAALEEGRVDIGTFLPNFFIRNREDLRVVFTNAHAITNYAEIFYTTRNDFAEENPDMIEFMLTDLWAGLQWWYNEGSDEEKLQVYQEAADVDAEFITPVINDPQKWAAYGGHDGMSLQDEMIQRPVNAMEETGYIPEAPDMGALIDNSYLPEEAQQSPSLGGF